MKRIVRVSVGDVTVTLNFSVGAWIELEETYGDTPGAIVKAIVPPKEKISEIFESKIKKRVLHIASVLIRYGSDYERIVNGNSVPSYTEEEIGSLIGNMEYVSLYTAILNAIQIGQGREIEATEDPKKKRKSHAGSMSSAWLIYYGRILNIPNSEFRIMPCGELFDLIACHQITHGAKEKKKEETIFQLMSRS